MVFVDLSAEQLLQADHTAGINAKTILLLPEKVAVYFPLGRLLTGFVEFLRRFSAACFTLAHFFRNALSLCCGPFDVTCQLNMYRVRFAVLANDRIDELTDFEERLPH